MKEYRIIHKKDWAVEFYRLPTKNTVISSEVFASTEELARSAAALLAAEASRTE